MQRNLRLSMIEDVYKSQINEIDQKIRKLQLDMNLAYAERDRAVHLYQSVCDHTWGGLVSMYGYRTVKTCTKCGLEQG